MNTLYFPFTWISKERPRFNRKTGSVYTPKRTLDAYQKIQHAARTQLPDFIYSVPLKIDLEIGVATKKSSDLDNKIKMLDALNPDEKRGFRGLWADDNLIQEIHARFVESETPYTRLIVSPLKTPESE